MRALTTTLLVFALIATAGSARGAAEETPHAPVLSLAQARIAVAAAVAEARKNGVGGAIAVVDAGGHLVALERLDGTFPAAASVATRKARTAATFQRPTADFENAVRGGRQALLAVPEMTPLQGGIPIRLEGQVVGAVGVSGAASADQDEVFAKIAAGAVR